MVDVTQADIDRIKADLRRELLQDVSPKPVNLGPVQPPIQETWWQQIRPLLTPIILTLLTLGGAFGVSRGWWTKEDVETVTQLVVNQDTGETTTVTTVSPSAKVKPKPDKPNVILQKPDGTTVDITKPSQKVTDIPIANPQQPAAITIEQVKPWIDVLGPIIQKMIEDSKKPPVVTPPTTIPPTNVPPVTNPPPITIPPQNIPPVVNPAMTLKLGVTDATGLPMASSSVPAGKLMFIKLEGFSSGKIVWTKRPTGDVQYGEVSGTQVAAIVLGPGAELDLFVTDYGIQQQVDLRVTANLGGQPPPNVDPVVVTPPVVNPPINVPPVQFPPGSRKFSLTIVEDPKVTRSVTTMSIMNNMSARKQLTDKGHLVTKTVPVSDTDPAAVYVRQQGTALPALAIQDNETHQFVKAVPLPTDLGVTTLIGMGG